MSDADALLAAIRANSDEDTPRLIYADCIEETDPARAELIRIQCLMASNPAAVAFNTFCRADTLIGANAERWRRAVCPVCNGRKVVEIAHATHKCDRCGDTGDAGGLMRETIAKEHWLNRVEFVRGMKRVHCRAADVWERLGRAEPGDVWEYFPTPWALAVCRHHPDCCELWITDREPYHYRAPAFPPDHILHGLFRWGRRSSFGEDNTDLVPDSVFNLLPQAHEYVSHALRYYVTADLARTALARTAVVWVWDAIRAESK